MMIYSIIRLVCCLSVVSMTSGEFDKRISCSSDFECDCHPIKVYPEKAVIENRIDCKDKRLKEIPTFGTLVKYPISKIILKDNALRFVQRKAFFNLTMENESDLSDDPVIDLSNNPLEELHGQEFSGIRAIHLVFIFNNCSFTEVPLLNAKIAHITSALYLRNNKLLEIGEDLFQVFSNLHLLDLSGNFGLTLQQNSFIGLENSLLAVYLEEIGLTRVPSKALLPLKHLSFLSLKYNRIMVLEDYTFGNYRASLMSVDLHANGLKRISKKAFYSKPESQKLQIKDLYLDYNRIKNLDFLEDACNLVLKNGTDVYLGHNPIICDCSLYNVTNLKVVTLHGKCYSPMSLNGAHLDWQPIHLGQEQQTSFPRCFPCEASLSGMCGEGDYLLQIYRCDCGGWVDYPKEHAYPMCPSGATREFQFKILSFDFIKAIGLALLYDRITV